MKKICKAYDDLLAKIGKDKEDALEEYEDILCDLTTAYYEEYFKSGFTIGFNLVIEAIKNKKCL